MLLLLLLFLSYWCRSFTTAVMADDSFSLRFFAEQHHTEQMKDPSNRHSILEGFYDTGSQVLGSQQIRVSNFRGLGYRSGLSRGMKEKNLIKLVGVFDTFWILVGIQHFEDILTEKYPLFV